MERYDISSKLWAGRLTLALVGYRPLFSEVQGQGHILTLKSMDGFALCIPPGVKVDDTIGGRFRMEADAIDRQLTAEETQRKAKVGRPFLFTVHSSTSIVLTRCGKRRSGRSNETQPFRYGTRCLAQETGTRAWSCFARSDLCQGQQRDFCPMQRLIKFLGSSSTLRRLHPSGQHNKRALFPSDCDQAETSIKQKELYQHFGFEVIKVDKLPIYKQEDQLYACYTMIWRINHD